MVEDEIKEFERKLAEVKARKSSAVRAPSDRLLLTSLDTD
jgi:hypothetical protein